MRFLMWGVQQRLLSSVSAFARMLREPVRTLERWREGQAQQAQATARAAVTRARNARDTNPGVFTQAELQAYDTQIANTGTAITQAEETNRVAEIRQEQEEAVEQQNLEARRLQAERDRTVRTRITEARTLVEQGRYDEALGVIDQILVLDPSNDYARGVRPLFEDRKLFLDQRKARGFQRQRAPDHVAVGILGDVGNDLVGRGAFVAGGG